MRFVGRAYRVHDPRWSFEPVSGKGAAVTGGRFNVVGQAALYLTLEPITALAECTQGFAARMLPLTLCEYDVACEDIADLSNAAGCEAAGVSMEHLSCAWLTHQRSGRVAPSQRVAQNLVKKGVAGALVPSFVPGIHEGATNLVLWDWGERLPHRVKVYDPDGRLVKARPL